MNLDDITVEVRNKSLERVGQILPQDLTLEVYPVFNDVGAWKVTLDSDHPMANELRTKGAGLIITGPEDVILSGPVESDDSATTPEDLGGTLTFVGIDDTIVLQDRLCYPKPSTDDVTAQDIAHDERTGDAESLLHAYVNANVGPGAVTARKNADLTMGTNGHHGSTITKKPRFQQLLNLLQEIALPEGLRFRVVQRGSALVFETAVVNDRTALIRLDARNGTLAGQRVKVTAPSSTRIIVAGQGEQEDRTFVEISNADSLAAEGDWGRRIEVFKDQRNTNDPDELSQAGLEILADGGFTKVDVQAIPNDDDNTMRLGRDWDLGDTISVVIEDQELPAIVTGLAIKAGKEDGFKVGALIGDPTGFSLDAALRKTVIGLKGRIDNLERYAAISETVSGDILGLQDDVAAAQTDIDAAQTDISDLDDRTSDLEASSNATKPKRLMRISSAFSLANNSLRAMTGWVAAPAGDDGNGTGLAYNATTGVFTCTVDGLYRIKCAAVFASNGTGKRQLSVWVNPTIASGVVSAGTVWGYNTRPGSTASEGTSLVDVDVPLVNGDTLCFAAFQTSGAGLNVASSTGAETYLSIIWDRL